MGKYIVMDVVFKASSLNYDQGSGNYQELKKITRWNGKQHTFVSRYALRYSLLETGEKMGLWKVDKGEVLTTETGKDNKKGSIQPSENALLSGKILEYPEFDLFGYLVTSTTPQNFRTAPVKLSHAVSMTPFNYDALFNANIGMANRMRKIHGDMAPNPFTAEEHETYYQYTVVIYVDSIGHIETYISKKIKEKKSEMNMSKIEIKDLKDKISFEIVYGTEKKNKIMEFKHRKNENVKLEEIILPFKKGDKSIQISENLEKICKFEENTGVLQIRYKTTNPKTTIESLIKALLYLKRPIKARDEDLAPKLLVLGLYENKPYKTFKDRIALVDELTEESIDEITETTQGDKKIVKVIHKTVKQAKPKFRIHGIGGSVESLEEKKLLDKINPFLKDTDESNNTKESEEIIVYKLPEIDVETDKGNEKDQIKSQ